MFGEHRSASNLLNQRDESSRTVGPDNGMRAAEGSGPSSLRIIRTLICARSSLTSCFARFRGVYLSLPPMRYLLYRMPPGAFLIDPKSRVAPPSSLPKMASRKYPLNVTIHDET